MKNLTLPITLLTSSLIIAATLTYTGHNLSTSSTNTLTDPTTGATATKNTIKVAATGTATATPDQAIISVFIQRTADTTAKAQSQVNDALTQIRAALDQANIPETDVQTSSISISPQYDYTDPGTPTITAQRASQSLSITMNSIGQNAESTASLIDDLAAINAITISGIQFGLNADSEESVTTQARENAIAKARTKAQALATASDLKLGDIITITESEYSGGPIVFGRAELAADSTTAEPETPTELNTGEVEQSVSVEVYFEIK